MKTWLVGSLIACMPLVLFVAFQSHRAAQEHARYLERYAKEHSSLQIQQGIDEDNARIEQYRAEFEKAQKKDSQN
jgi:superfamily II RNA helicase